MLRVAMYECPYCYTAVKTTDQVCPNCGREIARWQTGFYQRQPLPARSPPPLVRIALPPRIHPGALAFPNAGEATTLACAVICGASAKPPSAKPPSAIANANPLATPDSPPEDRKPSYLSKRTARP